LVTWGTNWRTPIRGKQSHPASLARSITLTTLSQAAAIVVAATAAAAMAAAVTAAMVVAAELGWLIQYRIIPSGTPRETNVKAAKAAVTA
jgi:hypothetical protein